jgi:hypothetical protein
MHILVLYINHSIVMFPLKTLGTYTMAGLEPGYFGHHVEAITTAPRRLSAPGQCRQNLAHSKILKTTTQHIP